MKYSVITTFHQPGLEQYAQKMIDTFESLWPKEIDLWLCAEACQPKIQRDNTHIINILGESPELVDFITRHRNNPLAHGQDGPPDVYHPKKQFRWDAVRFCYKVFSVALCAERIKTGWMIWIDADSHTHTPVNHDWLQQVCPDDYMMSYLGRGENYHSECGWVAYNLDHPKTHQFIQEFVGMYQTDSIFQEREWHDSFIWDVVRRRYMNDTTNQFLNLNPEPEGKGMAGHPFINSILGLHMDHCKGQRKEQGHSKPKEIRMHQDHPYWSPIRAKLR